MNRFKKFGVGLLFGMVLFGSGSGVGRAEEVKICGQVEIKDVDLGKVKEEWMKWYNEAREKNGLKPYKYNVSLERTAMVWSDYSKGRGKIEHKRVGQKSYYDYKKMVSWFEAQGISFVKRSGTSNVENINWGYYKCKKSDCTEDLVKSVRTGFNFFMREKGRKYRPHYDSIMSKNYENIGLGISVDEKKNRYYLTVHYGIEIEKDSLAEKCGYEEAI